MGMIGKALLAEPYGPDGGVQGARGADGAYLAGRAVAPTADDRRVHHGDGWVSGGGRLGDRAKLGVHSASRSLWDGSVMT